MSAAIERFVTYSTVENSTTDSDTALSQIQMLKRTAMKPSGKASRPQLPPPETTVALLLVSSPVSRS